MTMIRKGTPCEACDGPDDTHQLAVAECPGCGQLLCDEHLARHWPEEEDYLGDIDESYERLYDDGSCGGADGGSPP